MGPGDLSGDSPLNMFARTLASVLWERLISRPCLRIWNDHARGSVATLQSSGDRLAGWLLLASSVCGLFKWRQFEPEVILLAVGWYLRFSLSYRDVEELLAGGGGAPRPPHGGGPGSVGA